VHALTHLDELGQPQAFVAWLSTIVVRLAMTRLRKRHLLTRLGLRHAEQIDPDELTSGLSADARVALHDAYAVLAELAPEERVALVLRRVEGLELQEIATHMKLSLATVKRRLSAAEARIQALHEGGAR
jgi:RNA polymerase sigma-70 factor (ECF subfamily)